MKIVIVEDEAPIRNGMGKILHKINASYEVVGIAENGLQGLELIEKTRPDLIITDIQMPDMNGLEMLSQLRKKKNPCKAIVLTAYSNFEYAKQAIELGIENYILKPIKITELSKALKQVETNLSAEREKEEALSLENIFAGAMMGHLPKVESLDVRMKAKYGLDSTQPLNILLIWLGEHYDQNQAKVKLLLEGDDMKKVISHMFLSEIKGNRMIVAIYYGEPRNKNLYAYIQRQLMPVLCETVKEELICLWKESPDLTKMLETMNIMREKMDWNLLLGRGVILSAEQIMNLNAQPLKYPADLEAQAKQAIVKGNQLEFEKCFQRFIKVCRQEVHEPKEIKEVCMRYCWNVLDIAKESSHLVKEYTPESIVHVISQAVQWKEIEEALRIFFKQVVLTDDEPQQKSGSILAQQARQMIKENYQDGITLEEIADRLHVSDEYLSSQFKKETGVTFSETIRKYRMERIKQLLQESNLKLNQIANMVGYSDPKYMSKVFKEETGMLPAEFRKVNPREK